MWGDRGETDRLEAQQVPRVDEVDEGNEANLRNAGSESKAWTNTAGSPFPAEGAELCGNLRGGSLVWDLNDGSWEGEPNRWHPEPKLGCDEKCSRPQQQRSTF